MDDPLRARLGRLGRLLPSTNRPLDPRVFWQVARRLSVSRSLYYSARFRGRVLLARRTRVVAARSARVELAPTAWLLIGFHHHGPDRALLNLARGAHLVVDGTVQIWRGAQIHVMEGGRLELGDKDIFNEGSRVICCKSIHFGESSGLSWNATVLDSDLHPIAVGGEWVQQEMPVHIGDRVFLGAGATVLKGVRIGDGSVVAASALVNKDVPPRCLVGGNPARIIYKEVDWR